jgi:hypothetical protein
VNKSIIITGLIAVTPGFHSLKRQSPPLNFPLLNFLMDRDRCPDRLSVRSHHLWPSNERIHGSLLQESEDVEVLVVLGYECSQERPEQSCTPPSGIEAHQRSNAWRSWRSCEIPREIWDVSDRGKTAKWRCGKRQDRNADIAEGRQRSGVRREVQSANYKMQIEREH